MLTIVLFAKTTSWWKEADLDVDLGATRKVVATEGEVTVVAADHDETRKKNGCLSPS